MNAAIFLFGNETVCGGLDILVPPLNPLSWLRLRMIGFFHKPSFSFGSSTPNASFVVNNRVVQTLSLDWARLANAVSGLSFNSLFLVTPQDEESAGFLSQAVGFYKPSVVAHHTPLYRNSVTMNGHSSSCPRRIRTGHSRSSRIPR